MSSLLGELRCTSVAVIVSASRGKGKAGNPKALALLREHQRLNRRLIISREGVLLLADSVLKNYFPIPMICTFAAKVVALKGYMEYALS